MLSLVLLLIVLFFVATFYSEVWDTPVFTKEFVKKSKTEVKEIATSVSTNIKQIVGGK